MTAYVRPSVEVRRQVPVRGASLALSHDQVVPDTPGYSPARLLRMSNALQLSLDVQQVIETFGQEVRETVPFDGLRYNNSLHDVDLKVGRNSQNNCSYQLAINDQLLGEVTFTRKSKFAKHESTELETLLRTLVHPLRNALLYRQALLTAQKDPLTGVYNRAALNETLQREVELAQRHGLSLSLIVIDIDHFKRINDTYGHSAGDCLLKGLVDSAKQSIRRCDMLFRYGGEEFVVVLNNTDAKGAMRLAERIRRNIEKEEYPCADQPLKMTVSAGVAALAADESEEDLFKKADKALYRAKSAGRNRAQLG